MNDKKIIIRRTKKRRDLTIIRNLTHLLIRSIHTDKVAK